MSWLVEMGKVKRYLAGSGEIDPKVTDVNLVDYLRGEGYRVSYVGGPPPPDADMEYFFDVVAPRASTSRRSRAPTCDADMGAPTA